MPSKMGSKDFIRTNELIALGLLSVFIGLLMLILLSPRMPVGSTGFVLSLVFFLVIWLVIYIGMVIGALMQYYMYQQPPGKRGKK